MILWLKQLRCKHEIGMFVMNGTCVNACKICKKPMEVYK